MNVTYIGEFVDGKKDGSYKIIDSNGAIINEETVERKEQREEEMIKMNHSSGGEPSKPDFDYNAF